MAVRGEVRLAREDPPPPALENSSTRIRTVVVDDSETFLRVTCDLLDFEDVIDLVAAASGGEEAISTVARLKPELVLMDVSMPGVDGLQAARQLLAEMSPAPTVVLMSSEDTPQLRSDCWRAGAFGFVHKANFREEFEAVLRRVLQEEIARRTRRQFEQQQAAGPI